MNLASSSAKTGRKLRSYEIAHGLVRIEDTPLASHTGRVDQTVAAAVGSYKAGAFGDTCQALLSLTTFFSENESEILQFKVDLTPLEQLYEHHGFHFLMKDCFERGNVDVYEALVVHMQQLIVFVDFHCLFEKVFFLPSLVECLVGYRGARFAQFFVLFERLLPLQRVDNWECVAGNLARLREPYEHFNAVHAWLSFLLMFMSLPTARIDLCVVLDLVLLPDSDSPELFDMLYNITRKIAKAVIAAQKERQEGTVGVLYLIDQHQRELLSMLLKKPVEDNQKLVIDRIRLLETLLRACAGKPREQQCLLIGYEFDFVTVSSCEDMVVLPYVLRLYRVLAEYQPSIFLEKVATSKRIVEQLELMLDEGSFTGKQQAVTFMAEVARINGMRDFLYQLIQCNHVFDACQDVLAGPPELVTSYLEMLRKLIDCAECNGRWKKMLLEQIERAEVRSTVYYLKIDDPKITDLRVSTLLAFDTARLEFDEEFPTY